MPETFSYKGSDISAEVKAQFGDTGNVQINDTLILRWINNGQRQITASNPWLRKTFETNIVAGQNSYDLAALMTGLRLQNFSAVAIGDTKIPVVSWAEFTSKVASLTLLDGADKTPQIASEYGDDLVLWPTPDTAVANGLTIWYTAWPDDLTAIANSLTVPDRFYNALSDWVLSKALQLDENFEASAQVKGDHDAAIAQEMQRDKMNPTEFYPAVTFEARW